MGIGHALCPVATRNLNVFLLDLTKHSLSHIRRCMTFTVQGEVCCKNAYRMATGIGQNSLTKLMKCIRDSELPDFKELFSMFWASVGPWSYHDWPCCRDCGTCWCNSGRTTGSDCGGGAGYRASIVSHHIPQSRLTKVVMAIQNRLVLTFGYHVFYDMYWHLFTMYFMTILSREWDNC